MNSGKTAATTALLFLAFLILPARSANAQTNPQANPQPSTPVAPKVVGLEGNLEADDIIRVEVERLDDWSKTNDPKKLIPYLNGLALRGNYPAEIHASKNHIHFHLQITRDNKDTWVDLLGAPVGIRKPVTFSVGPENQSPFESIYDEANRVRLTVISPWYGVISLVVVLVTLVLFLWLARRTNIIREPGPNPVFGKLRPYNLGRTQMAFWFFLIYASYVVIWLITNALDTITASLLGLMGISAGTALSEALIDSGKDSATENNLQEMTAEKQAIEQTIPEIQSQIATVQSKEQMMPRDLSIMESVSKDLQDRRARLAQVNLQIQTLAPSVSARASAGFLKDILSDANGYSFHRFQIFAWTIVLGIIFISSVYNSLTMPEFSSTLLGLMGISSGTYIGFKFPERR